MMCMDLLETYQTIIMGPTWNKYCKSKIYYHIFMINLQIYQHLKNSSIKHKIQLQVNWNKQIYKYAIKKLYFTKRSNEGKRIRERRESRGEEGIGLVWKKRAATETERESMNKGNDKGKYPRHSGGGGGRVGGGGGGGGGVEQWAACTKCLRPLHMSLRARLPLMISQMALILQSSVIKEGGEMGRLGVVCIV